MSSFPGASKLRVTNELVAKINIARPKAYYSRGGTQRLEVGQVVVTVTFTTPLKDTNWVFGALTVWNSADAAVDIQQITAVGRSAKSQSSFEVLLSSPPLSDNYYLDWTIAEAFNP